MITYLFIKELEDELAETQYEIEQIDVAEIEKYMISVYGCLIRVFNTSNLEIAALKKKKFNRNLFVVNQ